MPKMQKTDDPGWGKNKWRQVGLSLDVRLSTIQPAGSNLESTLFRYPCQGSQAAGAGNRGEASAKRKD